MICSQKMNYCATLINIIKTSTETCFQKEQADKFLVNASLSHPYFKTLWINNNIIKDLAVINFKKAVLKKSKSEGIESSNIDDENILINMVIRHLHSFLSPKFIQIPTFSLKMKYQVF